MSLINDLKQWLIIAQKNATDLVLSSCCLQLFGMDATLNEVDPDEDEAFDKADVDYMRVATRSVYERYLSELSAEPLLDEDGEEDVFGDIARVTDVMRESYGATECAFYLYYAMTEGMKKAERHQKIKDPDFTKQYREALFGEMRTSFNRPASSDRLFSAYAPFTIYCRKLCELMIGEADKFCRKGKSKRTRIYFMGGLLSEAFRTALGCIHSMTVGNEKGAVSEWRSLYEKECTVIILHKNKKDLLDRFIKWRKYDYLHDPENTLQDERDEDQKEWGVGGSSVNYRHYGWIAPICEPNANIDRNLIEQLAGQSERKKEYQWSSEVSHSAHANGEQATKQMQKFICLELPKSLKNLVDIALEEIGHAERARSGDKTTTEAFRLLEQRTLETLDLALRFLPSVS